MTRTFIIGHLQNPSLIYNGQFTALPASQPQLTCFQYAFSAARQSRNPFRIISYDPWQVFIGPIIIFYFGPMIIFYFGPMVLPYPRASRTSPCIPCIPVHPAHPRASSAPPAIYLSTYLPTYLSIYLSIWAPLIGCVAAVCAKEEKE